MTLSLAGVQDDFDALAEHMSKISGENISKTTFVRFRWDSQWQPAVNLYEADDLYVICVDLASMNRREIDVRTDGRAIILSGTRPGPRPEKCQEDLRVHVLEIDEGAFLRRIPIPDDADPARVSARYANGLLWIDLQKTGR